MLSYDVCSVGYARKWLETMAKEMGREKIKKPPTGGGILNEGGYAQNRSQQEGGYAQNLTSRRNS